MTKHGTRDLFVIFRLDARSLALPLDVVDRVVRMVAVTPVVEAPPWCRGVINVQGQTVPVIDLRAAFSLAAKAPSVEDRLLISLHDDHSFAVIVDDVTGTIEVPGVAIDPSSGLGFDEEPVRSVLRHDGELIPVLDLSRLFSAAWEGMTRWLDRP